MANEREEQEPWVRWQREEGGGAREQEEEGGKGTMGRGGKRTGGRGGGRGQETATVAYLNRKVHW